MAVDAGLIVLLPILMAEILTGQEAHEWLGVLMTALFLLHHAINWKWWKSIGKGGYTPLRFAGAVINLLMLADILALAVSGIMMSGFVFDWLPISGGMILSRRLHLFASHWGLILMALHTGMHWNMLFSLGGACAKKKTPTVCWSGLQEGWHWLWLCLEFTPSSSKTWRTICSCGQRSCFGMKQNLHGCSLSKFFPSWACLSP